MAQARGPCAESHGVKFAQRLPASPAPAGTSHFSRAQTHAGTTEKCTEQAPQACAWIIPPFKTQGLRRNSWDESQAARKPQTQKGTGQVQPTRRELARLTANTTFLWGLLFFLSQQLSHGSDTVARQQRMLQTGGEMGASGLTPVSISACCLLGFHQLSKFCRATFLPVYQRL